MVKEHADILAPFITEIVNLSVKHGEVSDNLKLATITPILKKLILDCEVLANYRPISNLPFIAKVVEKVIATQVIEHVEANNLQDKWQSAYKEGHGTETALICVLDYILTSLGNGNICVLIMLDLSAAFDTVDHKCLINRLEIKYGITGIALQWLRSYLHDRKSTVCVNGESSEVRVMSTAVHLVY